METNRVLPEPPMLLATPDPRFSVLIISEIRLLGEGLAHALARTALLSHCEFCRDLGTALTKMPHMVPDIILLDSALRDGPASIARIRSIAPQVKVVALAIPETPENVIAWAEAGAVGYIPNTAALREVVPLLAEVMRGEQSCSRPVAAGLLRRLFDVTQTGAPRQDAPPGPMLTGREIQILELISNGLSNKEISRRLNIGLATTKSHVHNLLGKLGLQRRNQAAFWMREQPIRIDSYP
jgi:two-component system nitrate/nitrite response regulator NarL